MANKCELMMLHKTERKLIEYIRELKFGKIEVRVQDGLPVLVERSIIKTKLTDEKSEEG